MNPAPSLAEALGLVGAAGIVSLVGGGGKTSAMFALARELKAAGKKVLVTTTTNIGVPEQGLCDRELLGGCADLARLGLAPAGSITCLGNGIMEGEVRKLKSVDPAFIDRLQQEGLFNFILVEADGAKRKPIKAPAEYEPVIPSLTGAVIGVIGVDALGKTIDEENVHRCSLFCACTETHQGELIDPRAVIRLITAEGGLFKNAPVASRKIVLLNKADSQELVEQGEQIARGLAGSAIGCIITSLQQGKFYIYRSGMPE